MSCCCNNILHLCRVPVCGSSMILTGINADVAGEYILVLDYLQTEYKIRATMLMDAEIKFPSIGLNENFTFTGQIRKPDGTVLEFTVGEDPTVYNCISFQTGLSHFVNEEGSD